MTNQINCPICGNNSQEEPTSRDGYHILCPKCGEFFISRTLKINLGYESNKIHNSKISSYICEQNKLFNNVPELLTTNLDKIINQREKTIKEKFDCFMKTISNLNTGQIYQFNFNHCYIYDDNELGIFYQKALDNKYINGTIQKYLDGLLLMMYQGICFDGLEYIESLAQTNENSKNVFVAFYFTTELQEIFDNDVKEII